MVDSNPADCFSGLAGLPGNPGEVFTKVLQFSVLVQLVPDRLGLWGGARVQWRGVAANGVHGRA